MPGGEAGLRWGIPYHPVNAEVAGLLAAHFAWGRRDIILSKTWEALSRIHYHPVAFLRELKRSGSLPSPFAGFVHRTYNGQDLDWMFAQWSAAWDRHATLEVLFSGGTCSEALHCYAGWMREELPRGDRMRKHFASPVQGSACKRMLMFLRWMIRKDEAGVDLGIWNNLPAGRLELPLDVHAAATAKALGLLPVRQTLNWKAVEALGKKAKQIFPGDPALLDYALFGLGEEAKRTRLSVGELLMRWSDRP